MASNYEKICRDNLIEYGRGTKHLTFLERLYSERTHFIFELLQNAEDAKATRVRFELTAAALKVWHDGRIFDDKDVRGVCGIAVGTKEEDYTQIGKFGIGFKSVYAFTLHPEIHSGEEHFAIEKYIRPQSAAAIDVPQPWSTLFVLPFDRLDIDPVAARAEILKRLDGLDVRAMLFLRRIRRIEWNADNLPKRYLDRQESTKGPVRTVTISGRVTDAVPPSAWLVFESPVTHESSSELMRVEVAFRLALDRETSRKVIASEHGATLSAFFPTEKPTGMGFLIQGPYRTTPARDNIPKDDRWNRKLVTETAKVIVSALRRLKENGYLTVGTLETMPVRQADFLLDSMFRPIFDAVAEALKSEALLPTDAKGFAPAMETRLSRGGEMRKIFSAEILRALNGSPGQLHWLSADITENRTPDLYTYCRQVLKIEEVTPESLIRQLSRQFLQARTDDWIAELYEFLAGQEALWRKARWSGDQPGPVRSMPIVRLEDGTHVAPFKPDGAPAAYVSAPAGTVDAPIIRRTIASREPCRQFLEKLGLGSFDLSAMLKTQIIAKYGANCTVAIERNVADLRSITAILRDQKDPARRAALILEVSDANIVYATAADSRRQQYVKPGQVYFPEKELRMYFAGNANAWLLDSRYPEDLHPTLTDLGVSRTIRVHRLDKKPDWQGYIRLDGYSPYRRGANAFDPSVVVDGLAHAVSHPNSERSQYIWNRIAAPNTRDIKGVIEESSRSDFRYHEKSETYSVMGKLLVNSPWLPSGNQFHKPAEITLEQLPSDFDRVEILGKQLGMRVNAVAELAQKIGVEPEAIAIARQITGDKELMNKLQQLIAARDSKPEFPVRNVPNPARRAERISTAFDVAPQKVFEVRQRSVRTSEPAQDPTTWLREAYTNSSDQMVCQLCAEVMPFKKRDGQYYFEAVESLDHLSFEHQALYLALCPLCAAKYKEFVKRDPVVISQFREALMTSTTPAVQVKLGEQTCAMRFVDSHLFDLQEILRATLQGRLT